MAPKIILADDHPVTLLGLYEAISRSNLGEVVARATNGSDLLRALRMTACDVLITDYFMPDGDEPDGLVLINKIRRIYPRLSIVLLSAVNNLNTLRDAISAGVLGLVHKSSNAGELFHAIRSAQHGRLYIGRNLQKRAADIESGKNWTKDSCLSPREREVLRLLAMGMNASGIARKLNRSLPTISRQKHSAMRRLAIKSDAELFEYLKTAYQ